MSKKLLTGVLICSSCITVFVTGFRMYQKYHEELHYTKVQMETLFESNKEALANSIWELNQNQTDTILKGMLKFPGIDQVVLSFKSAGGETLLEMGATDGSYSGETFTLYSENTGIGTLKMRSDSSRVVGVLKEELALTLLIQALKTFFSSFLILIVFNKIITNRLAGMSSQVLQNHASEPVVLPCSGFFKNRDELDSLAEAVNTMKRRLSTRQEELEILVKERTKSLEMEGRKAREAAKVKSQFLANMSHEIRTPMNGIVGYADMLAENRSLDANARQQIRVIQQSISTLLTILNDILLFSSLEKNTVKIKLQALKYTDLLGDLLEPLRLQAETKGLTFKLSFGEIPEFIESDPARLSQIILNLTGNAVKFTAKGGVSIKVTWRYLEDSPTKGELLTEISDSGTGISEEDQKKLFREFTQMGSVYQQQAGTGLGLAISNRLAKLLSGSISVTSGINKGSTFSLRIMTRKCDASAAEVAHTENKEDPGKATRRLKILLAEDNQINQSLFRQMLKKQNVMLKIAENGRDAVEMAASEEFDIIFMDLQMPVMGGIQAAAAIRSAEKGNAVPIFALTANVLPEQEKKCKEAGMDGFLTKPVRKKELISFLHEYSQVREDGRSLL